jgi:hypothetical protein
VNWEQLINFADVSSVNFSAFTSNDVIEITELGWFFAALSDERIKNLSKEHNLSTHLVKAHADIDPSPSGKYVPWLLKHHQHLQTPEASRDISRDLSTYHNNQQRIPAEHRDINKHTPETLHSLVDPLHKDRNLELNRLPEGATLEHKSGPYHYVRIDKPEAAHKLCKDSGWCIGDSTNSHAKNMLETGPLHVVYKNGKRHAGLHLSNLDSGYSFQTHKENKNHTPEEMKNIMHNWPQGKKEMAKNPSSALWYVGKTKERVPEIEKSIASYPYTSLDYAKHLGGRFEQGEKSIASDPYTSLNYAKHLGGRFEQGEKSIASSPYYSLDYAKHLGGRFEQGEKSIASDPDHSLDYAKHLGGRFEQGEKSIASHPNYHRQYKEHLESKGINVA